MESEDVRENSANGQSERPDSESSHMSQAETVLARSSKDEFQPVMAYVRAAKQLSINSVAEVEEASKLTPGQRETAAVKEMPLELSYADYGLCLLSAMLFILDYIINLFIFQKYFQLHKEHNQFEVYFYLIVGTILLPPLITAVFEVVWYKEEKIKYGKALKWYQWIFRIILMVLLLGPAFRYVEVLEQAHKVSKVDDRNKKQKIAKDAQQMTEDAESQSMLEEKANKQKQEIVKKALQMKEDADFLYMLEKFTESGLHLVTQIFIVKEEMAGDQHEEIGAGEALKILMAILIMPYTVTMYVRSQRQVDERANNMNVSSTVIQFIWRLFIIIPQAVCLSFFLAMYPFAFMVITVSTWGLMAIWVFVQGTDFCRGRTWLECIFRFFVAFIYLFNFFNVSEGETYYKALFYYSFMFLERGLMMCFWCQADVEATWYRWPALFSFFLFFGTGIAIQLLYYGFHHPTKPTPEKLHKKLFAIGSKPKAKAMVAERKSESKAEA